jgi:protein TonB
MTAAAKVEDKPTLVPPPAAQIRITMADDPTVPEPQPASPAIIKNDASKTAIARNETANIASASPSTQNISSAFTSSRSGAAPAPARKLAAPPVKENKTVESESANASHYAPPEAAPLLSSLSAIDAPSFAALGEEADSGGLGGGKKVLIAAAIILALAALGYLGYGKPDKSSTATPTPRPVSTLQDSETQDSGQPAPALTPMSSPKVMPLPSTLNGAKSATQTSAPKTVAGTLPDMPSHGAGNPPVIRIPLDPGLGTKKPDSTPLLVKSNSAGTKTQAQSQDSAPPLPIPAVASANDSALSGLMSSASSNPAQPSLATARVSQGVSQGLLIKRVQPKYPPTALATHAQGAVQIEATINKEGNVTNLKVLSGDPVLAHAALEAVRQWRYKPYYLDGEPVEIETQITVKFKAD